MTRGAFWVFLFNYMEMKMNFHHKYNNLIFIEKNIIVSTFSFFYKCIFLKKYISLAMLFIV